MMIFFLKCIVDCKKNGFQIKDTVVSSLRLTNFFRYWISSTSGEKVYKGANSLLLVFWSQNTRLTTKNQPGL